MSIDRKTEYARQKRTVVRNAIFAGALSIAGFLLIPAMIMIAAAIYHPASFVLKLSLSFWILSGLGAIGGWVAALPTSNAQKLFTALSLIGTIAIISLLLVYASPVIVRLIVEQWQAMFTRPIFVGIGLSIVSALFSFLLSSLAARNIIPWAAQSAENSQTPASAPELHDTASLELAQLPNREHGKEPTQANNNPYPNLLSGSHFTLLKAPVNTPTATQEVEIVSTTHNSHYDYNM